jgi:3-oxoacyl-(acyl-carrier-protein) synthase/alpha-ketoglutarate-dependent taurine dioxygenase/acyl carrier protein
MSIPMVRTVLELLQQREITEQVALKLLKSLEAALPVAIIGFSARMPGSADLDEFWKGLKQGRDFVSALPEDRRQDVEEFYASCPRSSFLTEKRYWDAAYLNRIDLFDADFFGLSKAEVEVMDPGHRIFLETVYHALEDAAIPGSSLRGSQTGVYVSNSPTNYQSGLAEITPLAVPGNLPPFLASRVSHLLDLRGPAFAFQSTCSSSLLAVHEACQALRTGECNLAIVGGASLLVYPGNIRGVFMTAAGIVADDERCRPFDDAATGVGRGEGIAAFVLKPLESALRDRDRIDCVILGSASNNDGHSATLTAPNPGAQADVLRRAWKSARIDPASISYIEAHGTGTQLGDPVEVRGISTALQAITCHKQFCGIGSIKGNIGHLADGAAGLAGLLKVVLALRHEQIPPSINLTRPNRHIDFINSSVYPIVSLHPWPRRDGKPRRAGVSAFSFNGTNVHLVVEEGPRAERETGSMDGQGSTTQEVLLLFSAKTATALASLLASYRRHMAITKVRLPDLAHTLAVGRDHHKIRLSIVAASQEELLSALLPPSGQLLPETRYGADARLTALARSYISGSVLDWSIVSPDFTRKLRLPSYPFEGVRFWRSAPISGERFTDARRPETGGHSVPSDDDEAFALLVELWCELLPTKGVTTDSNFFELGGTSLHLMQLRAKLRDRFGIDLPFANLFEANTPRLLLDALRRSAKASGTFGPDQTAPVTENIGSGLSHAQQVFWFLREVEGDSSFYHAPILARLRGPIDLPNLKAALRLIHGRHALLRTRFREGEDGRLAGVVDDTWLFELSVIDLQFFEARSREENANRIALKEQDRRFNFLVEAPWRAALIKIASDDHILCLTLHHMVADLASLQILWSELHRLYAALRKGPPSKAELPASPQYREFVQYEARLLAGSRGAVLRQFWLDYLRAPPAPLDLPADFPRPQARTFRGGTLEFCIDIEVGAAIRAFCAARHVTPFVFFLSAFGAFLVQKARCRGLLVGSEAANRSGPRAGGMIGPMVNQFAIRLAMQEMDTFESFLASTQQSFVAAFDHQDLPFGKVVEALNLSRSESEPPLIRVKVLMVIFELASEPMDDLQVEFLPIPIEHSPFDLTLRLAERGGTFSGNLSYSRDLFRQQTVEAWLGEFTSSLDELINSPNRRLIEDTAPAVAVSASRSRITGRRRALQPRSSDEVTMYTPRTGWRFPLVVEARGGSRPLAEWIGAHRPQITALLRTRGAILFRGFDITDVPEFEAVARAVHPELVEYSEPSTPRPEYQEKIYVSTQYPHYHEIQAHSELSYTYRWPMKALFMCRQPAVLRGETPIADNREILCRLPEALRRKFLDKGVTYVRNYGDGLLIPWQEVFGTSERHEVEKYCRENGPMTCEWKGNDGLRTRQIRHAAITHPDTGELCWFNQSLNFHIDGLGKKIAQEVRNNFSEDDLPSNALFGDGTSISAAEVAAVEAAILEASYYLPWQRGDVMLVDNVLMSHGRNTFEGEREVITAFVEPRRDGPIAS